MRQDAQVQPLYEREPDSVPGPFYVKKDVCILCALPPQTAPSNITWSAETFRRSGGKECPTHCRIERQPETAGELEIDYVEKGLKSYEGKVMETETRLLRKLARKQGFALIPTPIN